MKKNVELKTAINRAQVAKSATVAAEKIAAKIAHDIDTAREKGRTASYGEVDLNAALESLNAARAAMHTADSAAVAVIIADGVPTDRRATTSEREIIFRAALQNKELFFVITENAMNERARLGRPFSVSECEKFLGWHFTTDHSGKMSGMVSVSSSPIVNNRCAARAKNPRTICAHCFARRMIEFYSSMGAALAYNSYLLSTVDIPADLMPVINALYFRIEAFGDTMNARHAENYLRLIECNPLVSFAWWTKNPDFTAAALVVHGNRPDNVNFIVSSPFLNKAATVARFPWVDEVFTVYDDDTARAHCIDINCGARHCLTCLRCYRHRTHGGAVDMVNESLK